MSQESRTQKKNIILLVVALGCLLVAIGSTVLYFKQEKESSMEAPVLALSEAPTSEVKSATALIQLLVESDKNKDKEVSKAEFKGSPELFNQIDTNKNGNLERHEIATRIQSLKGNVQAPHPAQKVPPNAHKTASSSSNKAAAPVKKPAPVPAPANTKNKAKSNP